MQVFRKRYTGPGENLPGLPAWESTLLRARGIDTPEKAERFLHPSLDDLYDPMRMHDMDKAVKLIRMAVKRGDKIVVYGDYDVDGVSAVTVLLETLLEEGANASFRIPARHSEGYGLNTQAVRELAEEYQLLITVDCGITNVAEVRLAKELGMTVIVTDHHEVPDILPPADAVLDPLLGDYPFRRLCGAGVALKICQALQGMAGVEKRIEVAALATVADVVPLTDENRVIVREGMRRMEKTERPGLKALIESAKVTFPMRSDDIGFRLGPRINAAGRLEDASQGVRLLMTRDAEEGKKIADHLNQNNQTRQAMEKDILDEAMALFPSRVNLRRDRVIILEGDGWNKGLIGLVAGRICEKFHHPTIVLSRQDGEAVGSCRSIPGVNIWEMLNLCADLFIRFGGHAQAAGLTIPVENIPEFRTRLNAAIAEHCAPECFIPVKEYDAELRLEDVTLDLIDELEALEPTGCGNPAPVFLTRGASVQEARRVGTTLDHLKISLLDGEAVRGGIAFGLGDAESMATGNVDVLYCPARNEFRGRVTPQLMVQAIRVAEEDDEETTENPDVFFLGCLQEMSLSAAKQAPSGEPGLRPEALLKDRLDRVDLSRDGIAKVYLALRDFDGNSAEDLAARAETTTEQVYVTLSVLSEVGLARWNFLPFEAELLPAARKTDLEQSPLMRYLRSI